MSFSLSDFALVFDASQATPISYSELEQRLQNVSECFEASWIPAQIAMQIAKTLSYGHDHVEFAVRVTEEHMTFIVNGMTLHALFNEKYQGRKNNIPDAHHFVHLG